LTVHDKATQCAVGRTLHRATEFHCVAAGGDWLTAMHVNGGLCAVLSEWSSLAI